MKIYQFVYNMVNLEMENFEYEKNYIKLTSLKVMLF